MGLKETSKFISLILRHKPEVIGISLDEHGWADVQEMIRGINAAGNHYLDEELLEEIVRTDEKQRYSFTMIRDFIQILDVKRQNPEKDIRDILAAYKFAVDEETVYEDNN